MCISAEALALFLNLLDPGLISSDQPGALTIHATERDANWVLIGDLWCTEAPQIDRLARFED